MASTDETRRRKWLRGLHRRRRNAVEFGLQADQQIERLLLRRFERLLSVKRFVLLWVSLFVLLIVGTVVQGRALSSYYQTLQPAPGGIYSEGIIGRFTNANPIYASTTVDRALSRLVFSSLFEYDQNNQLIPDLVASWSQGPAQTHYEVKLRQDVKWHDGFALKADDVVFTYATIKNIEAQSPLYNSWKDINVTKVDDYTITFDLPSALISFPYNMTNGILPEHLLKQVPAPELRSALFNVDPIGSGPFEWKFFEAKGTPGVDLEQHISLSAYKDYHAGAPKLDGFNLAAFTDEKQATAAFKKKQINALAGLEIVPTDLAKDKSIEVHATPTTTAVMAFFNLSHGGGLDDIKVRKALVSAVDRSQFSNINGYATRVVDGPLLRGQIGHDGTVVQPPFDQAVANQLLDSAGWVRGQDGYRYKEGRILQLKLRSQDTKLYTLTSQQLQTKWGEIGVKIDVQYHDGEDLQGSVISSHDYDILVYGINIGVDPDVFAYWHSSQASVTSQGRLNLSEYKSATADAALEGGRSRADANLRTVKYKPFLVAWMADLPAVGLYQPNFIYLSRGPVFNYERKALNTPSDRYFNVDAWMIRQNRQNLK